MMIDLIFLQAGADPGYINLIFFIGIAIVFFFFIIRPQQKKQKEQTNFTDNLEKGMEVVTASGIIGKINKIEDPFVTLQVDTKTFIKFTKNAISKEMTEAIQKPDESTK